jgi:histidinol-phosphate aminotransferase
MNPPTTVDRLAIARAQYASLTLYDPKRDPVDLDLTDNTNLWGMPPAAERTLREVSVQAVTRYPSLYCTELKVALGDHLGVSPDMLVTGCGSDDVLDCTMRAFGEPGQLVAVSEPSFLMVPVFARLNSLECVAVPERADRQPDLDAMLATGARILSFCSPNNPTGTIVARDLLERAVADAPGMVVIDEAYAEFAGVSVIDLVARSERVLVVRTFSKAFGLAGLRLGYAVGQPQVVREVEKARGPYKVNALAERCAIAALREDRAWVADHAMLAVMLRNRLDAELRARGFTPLPSGANFLCVPVAQSVAVGQALRARGVAARPFAALPHVGDTLRVSVGPWPLMERFLDAFDGAIREVHG